VVFLVSYLIRFAISGAHKYPGTGWDKTVYLIILATHSLLALVVLPMVIRSLWLAARGRYADHRRIARWTWPIWMYVSVTGVTVYVMLYHVGPALR